MRLLELFEGQNQDCRPLTAEVEEDADLICWRERSATKFQKTTGDLIPNRARRMAHDELSIVLLVHLPGDGVQGR